jgi:UDP-glucuronate decarboxylase
MTNSILISDLREIHAALGARNERFEGAVVVITGCAGFLGAYFTSYLVRHAKDIGVRRVIGLDTFLLDKPWWLETLARDYPDVLVLRPFDISRDALTDIPEAREARFVIHMASIASPTFYRQYPLETIDANIWGLRRLLDFYTESKALEGFLFFSSSEIYGDPEAANIPTDEEYRGNVACVGPRACYDESKRFGETLCHVFATTRGVPITVARPFNNYGPGMRLGDRRLPADLAKCVMEGRDIVLYSDGSPTRTFCYISDAITGYFLCLLHGKFDAFNIGIEKPEITIRQLANIYKVAAGEIIGYTGEVRFEVSEDKDYLSHNPQRRCPIIAKARTVLGYSPKIYVEDGVRRYLRYLAGEREV